MHGKRRSVAPKLLCVLLSGSYDVSCSNNTSVTSFGSSGSVFRQAGRISFRQAECSRVSIRLVSRHVCLCLKLEESGLVSFI